MATHVSLSNVGGLIIGACQKALSTLGNTSLRWLRRQCGRCLLCTLFNPEDAVRESPNIIVLGGLGSSGTQVLLSALASTLITSIAVGIPEYGDWLEQLRVGRRLLRWSRWLLCLCLFIPPSLLLAFARSRSLSSSTLRNGKPSRFRSALAVLDLSFPFPLESFLELSELLLLRSSALVLPQPFPLVLQVSNRIGSSVSLGLSSFSIRTP